ncbi:MAG: hypothetical protein ABL998_04065 [Planctomycetota bacterium]
MKAPSFAARADRASLLGLGLGLALMCVVSAPWAFRAGFFLVLGSTVAQIVFSHLAAAEDAR